MSDAHFSLSSFNSGSRHRHEPSQWDVISGLPPQPDGFVSEYTAMSIAEPYSSIQMMTSDATDAVYEYAATNVLSRHAPLSSMDQAQVLPQDYVMPDYMPELDYVPCTTAMDGSSVLATEPWTYGFQQRPLTPPDEEELRRYREPSRHAPLPQETLGCEPLGLSKLQPYRLDISP